MAKPFKGQLFGLALITLLAGLLPIFLDPLMPNLDEAQVSDADRYVFMVFEAVKEWQTLLAGSFALLSAGFAGTMVMRQIRHSEELEAQRRARRLRASLAVMPSAMSQICDYAETSYRALRKQWTVASRTPISAGNNPEPSAPTLNFDFLSDIKLVIENVSSDQHSVAYTSLLSDLQVHQARWAGRLRDIAGSSSVVPADTFANEMVEAAELYAQASNIIGSTRPKATAYDVQPMTRASAVRLLDIHAPSVVKTRANRLDTSRPLPSCWTTNSVEDSRKRAITA